VSAALQRLPALATTGVGSLPFTRSRDAVEHVLAAYDLPFCPQLPRLEGDMVTEWLGADPARCGWSPDRDRQLPAAWDAFAAALAVRPPGHGLVKLQVTGPVTLAVALERAAGRDGRAAAVIPLAEQIALWQAVAATERTRWLDDELGLDTLVVVDEPGLDHAGLKPADARVWDPLRQAGTAWGLHLCCRVPWRVIAAAAPDVLSFDLLRSPVGPAAAPTLAAIVRRRGRIAWGALEAGGQLDAGAGLARIRRAWASLRAGLPDDEPAASWLVSAGCGTGGRPPAVERSVARALADLSALGRGEPVPATAVEPMSSVAEPAPAGRAQAER
jgi:hypothetical protein